MTRMFGRIKDFFRKVVGVTLILIQVVFLIIVLVGLAFLFYATAIKAPGQIRASDGKIYALARDNSDGYKCVDSTLYVVKSKMMAPAVRNSGAGFTYLSCSVIND